MGTREASRQEDTKGKRTTLQIERSSHRLVVWTESGCTSMACQIQSKLQCKLRLIASLPLSNGGYRQNSSRQTGRGSLRTYLGNARGVGCGSGLRGRGVGGDQTGLRSVLFWWLQVCRLPLCRWSDDRGQRGSSRANDLCAGLDRGYNFNRNRLRGAGSNHCVCISSCGDQRQRCNFLGVSWYYRLLYNRLPHGFTRCVDVQGWLDCIWCRSSAARPKRFACSGWLNCWRTMDLVLPAISKHPSCTLAHKTRSLQSHSASKSVLVNPNEGQPTSRFAEILTRLKLVSRGQAPDTCDERVGTLSTPCGRRRRG